MSVDLTFSFFTFPFDNRLIISGIEGEVELERGLVEEIISHLQ